MPWEGWWQVPQLRPFAPSGRKKASPVPGSVETRPASLWKPTPPDGSGLVPFAGTVAGSPGRAGPPLRGRADAGSGAPRAERNVGPRYGGACAGTGGVSAARTAGRESRRTEQDAAVTARRPARLLRVRHCFGADARNPLPAYGCAGAAPGSRTARSGGGLRRRYRSRRATSPGSGGVGLDPHAAPPTVAVLARSGETPPSGGRRQPTRTMVATDGTPAPLRMNSM